ncbi:helix-turn-helix domain-containing protein [Microbispora sp. ATCC PTA-5024]|uniref:helix-turn-helix domain-containing protein n=1 Tax=Microbispora sp. ATCC PTA-5024 TaxID=316330 RepID=UPI003FA58EF1
MGELRKHEWETLRAEYKRRYLAGETVRGLAAATGRSYGFVHQRRSASSSALAHLPRCAHGCRDLPLDLPHGDPGWAVRLNPDELVRV